MPPLRVLSQSARQGQVGTVSIVDARSSREVVTVLGGGLFGVDRAPNAKRGRSAEARNTMRPPTAGHSRDTVPFAPQRSADCSPTKRVLAGPLVVGFAVLWNVWCGVVNVNNYHWWMISLLIFYDLALRFLWLWLWLR